MITTGRSAAPEQETRSQSWGDIAFRMARQIAAMPDHDRGGLAGLRRMNPDGPDTASFWRLMAKEELLGNPIIERKWALILHGIALMTHTAGGDDVASRSAHNGGVAVGQALHLSGYSQARFNRLLTARDDMLRVLLARMFRMLAANDVSFDWREMASFIMSDGYDKDRTEAGRRRMARAYYQAERRANQQSEE